MDWLLLGCIASFIAAIVLGFILFANWQADRTWQRILREISEDAERAARFAEHQSIPGGR